MDERVRYNDFSGFLAAHFPYKVQKISINAGFTCPNRDGTKGIWRMHILQQPDIQSGVLPHGKILSGNRYVKGWPSFPERYPKMKYLAYFQAYTNTYAGLEELKRMYERLWKWKT